MNHFKFWWNKVTGSFELTIVTKSNVCGLNFKFILYMYVMILFYTSVSFSVFHPVQCEGCHRESFMGFRYKCQRCYNYQLCQDCFWRGRTSGNHSNDHEMKEYTTYVSDLNKIIFIMGYIDNRAPAFYHVHNIVAEWI